MKVELIYKDANYNAITRRVNPVCTKPVFKYEKDTAQALHRITFDGDLVFINNEEQNIWEYEIFNQYPHPCEHFEVWVTPDCVLPTGKKQKVWKGYFTIYMGKFDHDRKTFTVTPKPFDAQYRLDKVWKKEFNLLEVADKYIARATVGVITESKTFTWTQGQYDPPASGIHNNGGADYTGCNSQLFPKPNAYMATAIMDVVTTQTNIAPLSKTNWFVYDMAGKYTKRMVNGQPTGDFQPQSFKCTMFRTVAYTLKDADGNDVAPENNNLWDRESDTNLGGQDATKWTRRLPYFMQSETELAYNWKYYNCGNSDQWGQGWDYWVRILPPPEVHITYNHTRRILDCVNYMLAESGLQVQSEYFSNVFAPMYDPADQIPNPCQNILVANKSDIVRPDASNPATLWNVKLNEFIEDLCNGFNLQWAIVGNKLVIEHVNYWDNGASYLGTKQIGIDVPGQHAAYGDLTNAWEYTQEEFAAVEKWTYPDAASMDWQPAQVIYNSLCLGDETKGYDIKTYTTDLPMCQNNFQADRKGLMLLACNKQPAADGIYDVRVSKSYYADFQIPNGELSWTFLMFYAFRHGRLLATGKMIDKEDTYFYTTRPIKKQVEIKIPMCCTTFDAAKLVRTVIGDGIVQTAVFDLKTGMLTLNILHYGI